jgi:hypothetical protein
VPASYVHYHAIAAADVLVLVVGHDSKDVEGDPRGG